MAIDLGDWKQLPATCKIRYSVRGVSDNKQYLDEDIEVKAISEEFQYEDVDPQDYNGTFIFTKPVGSGGFIIPKAAVDGKEVEFKSNGYVYKLQPVSE